MPNRIFLADATRQANTVTCEHRKQNISVIFDFVLVIFAHSEIITQWLQHWAENCKVGNSVSNTSMVTFGAGLKVKS